MKKLLFPQAQSSSAGASQAGPSTSAAGDTGAASTSSANSTVPKPKRRTDFSNFNPTLFDSRYRNNITPTCVVNLEPRDIISKACDIIVVSTSRYLSLEYGLARILVEASQSNVIQTKCAQSVRTNGPLKFGETFLCSLDNSTPNLPFRYVLFIALPNDKKQAASVDKDEFKATMLKVFVDMFRLLANISNQLQISSAALPPLGATFLCWPDYEDYARVLVESLSQCNDLGNLKELYICSITFDPLIMFRKHLQQTFGTPLEEEEIVMKDEPVEEDNAAVNNEKKTFATTGSCDICADNFSAKNPHCSFHCDKGKMCFTCEDKFTNFPNSGLCPFCQNRFQPAIGTQPENGDMQIVNSPAEHLPGYPDVGTITVTYSFKPGTQSVHHGNPGAPFSGRKVIAYFPASTEGLAVTDRLKRAFKGRAVFTIGVSATTGRDNVITFDTIHHKTSRTGGLEKHGYPDDTYLDRVSKELAALGY